MTATSDAMAVPGIFFQTWIDFCGKCNEAGTEFTKGLLAGGAEAPADLEVLRRRWLDALARSMDAYLRTPAFLEAIHHHFDAVTLAKSTADDLAKEAARNSGIPHLDDLAGLVERFLAGQAAILERLTAIERRLDAVEGTKRTNGHRKSSH